MVSYSCFVVGGGVLSTSHLNSLGLPHKIVTGIKCNDVCEILHTF